MAVECYKWDFTLPWYSENSDFNILQKNLRDCCKKFAFQLELSDNGYKHYQGRISLVKKKRITTLKTLFKHYPLFEKVHFSPTSGNCKDFDYVMKADTRIEGPWKDTDKIIYIPRQYRNLTMRPWQQQVIDDSKVFSDRIVNVIYDRDGCSGKSTLASYCELMMNGIDMPPINDMKELIATLCDICMDLNIRDPNPVFMDLPRAMDKDRLYGIYTAIEQIKKGKLYDLRYKYKCWWIDSPAMWVFTNELPSSVLLSKDRWKIWTIKDKEHLVPYNKDTDEHVFSSDESDEYVF